MILDLEIIMIRTKSKWNRRILKFELKHLTLRTVRVPIYYVPFIRSNLNPKNITGDVFY